MPIRRSKYQSDKTLQEFYTSSEWGDVLHNTTIKMMQFVDWINETFKETEFVSYTSHLRLCIQDKDDEKLNGIIIISYFGLDEYFIDYAVPEYKSPWKQARMTGTAYSFDEIKKFFIIAMLQTENWKNNKELEREIKNWL